MNKKIVLHAALAGALMAGMSSGASALVMNWDFRAFGGFTGAGNDSGFPANLHYKDPLGNPGTAPGDYGHFGWGTALDPNLGHSHLTINELDPTTDVGPTGYYRDQSPLGPVSPGVQDLHGNTIGQIATSDDLGEVIGWAIHHNNPIEEIFGPAIVRTNYHLQLIDPANPGVVVWDSGEMDFTLEVWETRNSAPCPPDNTATGPEGSVCDDRFRFSAGWDGMTFPIEDVFDEIIGSFDYMGDNYNVSLTGFWDGLDLEGAYWSAEADFRHMEVRAEVHVPEPASIALMGLGLAGMGFAARRKHPKSQSTALTA